MAESEVSPYKSFITNQIGQEPRMNLVTLHGDASNASLSLFYVRAHLAQMIEVAPAGSSQETVTAIHEFIVNDMATWPRSGEINLTELIERAHESVGISES
jgi:hypothetical protein